MQAKEPKAWNINTLGERTQPDSQEAAFHHQRHSRVVVVRLGVWYRSCGPTSNILAYLFIAQRLPPFLSIDLQRQFLDSP